MPDYRDKDTLAFVEQLYQDARREKRKFVRRWDTYYRLVRNETWSQFRDRSLPSPQASEIFPVFATLIAYMLDQYPEVYVSPDIDPRYFEQVPPDELLKEKSTDMQDVIASWYVTNGIHAQRERVLWDTFTFGCGIFETGFDPSLNQGQGDVFANWVDPYSICPDPNASSFEDASYVVKVSDVPLFELQRRYPDRAKYVDTDTTEKRSGDKRPITGRGGLEIVPPLGSIDRTGEFPGTPGTRTSNLYGKPGDSPADYTETVRLLEVWSRGTERMEFPVISGGEVVDTIVRDEPKWEYVAVAGGVVLNDDTSNPFDHGQLPFVRLPMVQLGGEFWSVPLSEHLQPNQIALNRLLAAMQSHAEITGNPILLEPVQSGITKSQIVNRPGSRLTTEIAATNLVRWLDPPNMSPAVMQLIGFHRDTIDRVSGISAVARGTQLRRREPAAAVDAVQEASFVRIRAVLRNDEEALRQVCDQVASNIVQFYTEPRSVPVIGPKGSERSTPIGPSHFRVAQFDQVTQEPVDDEPLRFRTWVQAGSSQPISRQARAAEADMLFQAGALDKKALLVAHDWPDAEKVAAELEAKEQQMAMQAMAAEAQGGTT